MRADREALVELENLAIEGLNSGEAIAPGPEYWADKHRKLDERFKSAR